VPSRRRAKALSRSGGKTTALLTSPRTSAASSASRVAYERGANAPPAASSATTRREIALWLASKTPSRMLRTLVARIELNAKSATSGTAISVMTVKGSRSVARTSRTTSVRSRRRFMSRSV
jgi:hypothetical protein